MRAGGHSQENKQLWQVWRSFCCRLSPKWSRKNHNELTLSICEIFTQCNAHSALSAVLGSTVPQCQAGGQLSLGRAKVHTCFMLVLLDTHG